MKLQNVGPNFKLPCERFNFQLILLLLFLFGIEKSDNENEKKPFLNASCTIKEQNKMKKKNLINSNYLLNE